MDLRLEVEFSKTELTANIDSLKNQIDKSRPLSQEIEEKVMQKLRLEWNYHSNAIEGNRLNYGETVAFLMTGITAKGKSLKDHLDIRGHNEAVLFLLSIVKDERDFTESDIRALHEMILVEPYDSPAQTADGISTKKRITLGEYKSSPNHVKTITGETHFYASPEETPAKMQELMDWYKEANQNKEIHPLILAALFHYKFVAIHPFDDGNGRLSRILMNLILMRNGFPPVIIKLEDRQNYYSLLSQADTGNYWPFIEYIGDYLATSLNLYLKAIEGGDIDEPEDIDKEIALFKLELQSKVKIKEKKTNEVIERVIVEELEPLFEKIIQKVSKFEELFFSKSFYILMFKDKIIRFEYSKSKIQANINSIKEKKHPFEFIIIQINLNEFKSLNNNFNITCYFKTIFNEYDYTIINENSDVIVSKLYHEKLTQQDNNLVIKNYIIDIQKNIQKNL
jgi:Fic family protein